MDTRPAEYPLGLSPVQLTGLGAFRVHADELLRLVKVNVSSRFAESHVADLRKAINAAFIAIINHPRT